ncbi:MAG: T9SS C-terminal target domain-containing protein, partial [Ignavibacteria bacterium]
WKIFHAAGESSNFENTFAFPNPFAPGLENIKIKYLLQNNADVSIRIFNFSMQLVKTLLQNAPRTGGIEQIENWDGRDEGGRLVPNGVYFYRIDVNGSKGIYGKIMAVR